MDMQLIILLYNQFAASANKEPEGELLVESKNPPLQAAPHPPPRPDQELQSTYRTETELLIGQEASTGSSLKSHVKGTGILY